MKRYAKFLISIVTLLFVVCEGRASLAVEGRSLRIAVVGDTGIGERAFHPGFEAVQKAMAEQNPDVLLHLGDFVYQPEWFPENCPEKYIEEIRETLVRPFRFRIFVAGDNDLPPKKGKPRASGCWEKIAPMRTPFDPFPERGEAVQPRPMEGTRVIGNVLFVVLDSYGWRDPGPWVGPIVKRARADGRWIIFSLHEPALTTAWFLDKRQTVLKQINALNPDLVFAGNQHSYERFYPLGIPDDQGVIPHTRGNSSGFKRGEGPIHIVAGGGGATFKPFADMQGISDRTAPQTVFDALAARALMNHFLIIDALPDTLTVSAYRVCPKVDPGEKSNPRWRPHKPMWNTIPLECDNHPPGTTLFEKFEIRAQKFKE